MSKARWHSFKVRGPKFKADVLGKLILHEEWWVRERRCQGGGGDTHLRLIYEAFKWVHGYGWI